MVEGSDVVLTESIIKDPKEFTQTFFEFISRGGLQIVRAGNAAGSTITLFTVPANKTFYLTGIFMSASLAGSNVTVSPGISTIRAQDEAWVLRLTADVGPSIIYHGQLAITFNPPIKFEERAIIRLGAPASTRVDCTITGMQVDKELVFRR